MVSKGSTLSGVAAVSSSTLETSQGQGQGGNGEKDPHGAPGSTWNNKKAQEELEKATNLLTDKNWSMR